MPIKIHFYLNNILSRWIKIQHLIVILPISSWFSITWRDKRSDILSSCANLRAAYKTIKCRVLCQNNLFLYNNNIYKPKKKIYFGYSTCKIRKRFTRLLFLPWFNFTALSIYILTTISISLPQITLIFVQLFI